MGFKKKCDLEGGEPDRGRGRSYGEGRLRCSYMTGNVVRGHGVWRGLPEDFFDTAGEQDAFGPGVQLRLAGVIEMLAHIVGQLAEL